MGGASERDQLLARRSGQVFLGRPALQQAQHGGRPQLVAGDLERGWVGAEQVHAQPVEQAALVLGGATSAVVVYATTA
jgi:hypothetical protein